MNKYAVTGAAVVLAALVGVPPVIGSFTEARVMAQARRIETLSQDAYRIEVLDYDGGWFGSTARVQASLGEAYIQQVTAMATRDQEDESAILAAEFLRRFLSRGLTLLVEIGHGPVMLAGGMQVGVLSAVIRPDPGAQDLAEWLEALEAPYLFEVRTLTGITGTTRFAGDVPPLEIDFPNGRVSFSGFTVEGAFDLRTREIDTRGAMEFLRVDAADWGSTAVEDVLLTVDLTGISPVLWLGDVVMEVGSLTSAGVGPEGPFSLAMTRAGAHFDTTLDTTGELVTIEGRYYVGSLMGPDELNLADASFAFAMRDFSREALAEYSTYGRQIAVSPETAPPLIPGVENLLYLTLASSPSVEVGPAEFRWNGQPFEANLRIELDGSDLPQRAEFTMFNWRAILAAISVEGYADMSEDIARTLAVANLKRRLRSSAEAVGKELPAADLERMAQTQAAGMLSGLVLQGMIETSAAGYRSDLTFSNGELSINGNVMPLGMLLR
jgi:uncharacterized protein YdgA (DUF945 family)